jgi:hypothetical protein
MNHQADRIRALNDKLRTSGERGEILITRGIRALGRYVVAAVIAAVQAFEDFTSANDPHRERDFALIEVCGHRVMFKIDYYNLDLSGHSPDASDATLTRRVLTVMLAEEY